MQRTHFHGAKNYYDYFDGWNRTQEKIAITCVCAMVKENNYNRILEESKCKEINAFELLLYSWKCVNLHASGILTQH